jgi:sialidase-1
LSDDELSAPPSREVTRDTVLYLPMDQVRGGH